MRGRILLAIAVAIACVGVAGSAMALITSASGEVHQGPAPASVAINQHQHDDDTGPSAGAHAFNEEQDHTTTSPIALDVCTTLSSSFVTCLDPRTGLIDRPDRLSPGTIPAGTCIDSHMIHADAPGNQLNTVYGSMQGQATEVRFASPILGVILLSPSLSLSDADPGLAPAVTYGTADATRGLELVPAGTMDAIQIVGGDRVRIQFTVTSALDYDQIRVITMGDPAACPGQAKQLTLTPDAAINEVDTEHCVTATVKNTTGGPAAGVVVRFDVEGASEEASQAPIDASRTTGADGTATLCYQGPQTVGSDDIHAYADNDRDNVQDVPTDPADDATKTWAPAEANRVELTPKADENPVGTEHCVQATVEDAFGNPIPNERVRFVVTGTGDRSGADQTDELGVAEFCYSSQTSGLDVITAHHDEENQGERDLGEPFDVAGKLWAPGDPATLVLEPKVAENRVQEQHCVQATVRDAFGNLVPDARVRFIVTGVNMHNGANTTDEGGQAEFCYTGGTQAGPDDILAYADNDGDDTQDAGEPADTATKLWLPLEPAFLTLTPKEDENVVGDEHCVQAAVTDIFLNPNPDEPVRFVVTRDTTVREQATVRTDRGGIAEFCYTSTTVGQDAIHAWADSVEEDDEQDPGEPFDDATKTWYPDDPAVVVLTPEADTNEVGTEHCVKAEVRDQFGNPTPNETIVFDVEGASEGDSPPDEDGSDQTDEFGNAQLCYTGPDLPGADTIVAFADFDRDDSGPDRPNGTREDDEPRDTAEKTWIFPASTPGCEITITEGGWIETFTGSKGTFGGNAKVAEEIGPLGQVSSVESGELEYHDHDPALDLNFHSVEIVAIVCGADGRADIYGLGRVEEGVPVTFRVRVRDSDEPGRGDTYQLLTNAYVSGPEDNPLLGGNIQVHQQR